MLFRSGKPGDFHNEDLLYRLFGVNAELLIDHAWGWECCTIADIKNYKPESNSIGSGQVLQCPYDWKKARLVVQEMTDMLVLDLVERSLVTDQIVLSVGYDRESLENPIIREKYRGAVSVDRYGRQVPKHAHGTTNLNRATSSTREIMDAVMDLYDRIVNPDLLVRRLNVTANHVVGEGESREQAGFQQMDLFTDYHLVAPGKEKEQENLQKEKKVQQAVIDIKKKFGKNAILRGMSLEEGGTARDRNSQIGGHKA